MAGEVGVAEVGAFAETCQRVQALSQEDPFRAVAAEAAAVTVQSRAEIVLVIRCAHCHCPCVPRICGSPRSYARICPHARARMLVCTLSCACSFARFHAHVRACTCAHM